MNCRGPFPEIPLLPTGGVTLDTSPAFIAAGAVGVGMGGWLLGDGSRPGSASAPAPSWPPSRPLGRAPADDRGRDHRRVPHRVRRGHARPAGRGDHLRALRRRRRGERRGRAGTARASGGVHRSGREPTGSARPSAERLRGEGVDIAHPGDRSGRADRADVPRATRTSGPAHVVYARRGSAGSRADRRGCRASRRGRRCSTVPAGST